MIFDPYTETAGRFSETKSKDAVHIHCVFLQKTAEETEKYGRNVPIVTFYSKNKKAKNDNFRTILQPFFSLFTPLFPFPKMKVNRGSIQRKLKEREISL